VRIPPAVPHERLMPLQRPDDAGDTTGFAPMGEVMITKVRGYLSGGTTAGQVVLISIEHNGLHELVRRDGESVRLTSSPVRTIFKYQTAAGGKHIIKQDGDVSDGDLMASTGRYSPMSPFTAWRIVIDRVDNPKIDWSQVTALDLEFHGGGYPFVVAHATA